MHRNIACDPFSDLDQIKLFIITIMVVVAGKPTHANPGGLAAIRRAKHLWWINARASIDVVKLCGFTVHKLWP